MNFIFLGIILIILIFILYLRYLILFLLIPRQLNRAVELLNNDEEGEAIEYLTHILKLDRGNPVANWLMAEIYIKKKQYVLAQMYLYDILYNSKYTQKITEVRVRETLAYLYQKIGDFNKAIIQYLLLKKNNQLSLEGVKRSIRIAVDNKNYNQAELLLKFIKTLDSSDGEIDYFRAVIDFNHSALSAAERKLKVALEKGYENYDINLLLGKIYFFTKKYNLALKHFQKLSTVYLDTEELEGFIGQCSYYLKDYDTTIEVLEDFLSGIKKKNKFTANLEYILGAAYEAVGNIDKAVELWKDILNYAPLFRSAKEKLYFYNSIAKDPLVRDIIMLKAQVFMEKCEQLIEAMDYSIKKKLFADEWNLEYLCDLNKSTSMFNLYYFFLTRRTQPITVETLNNLFLKARQRKTRSVIVVAPHFHEDAMMFAKRNGITVHTYDIFKEKL